MTTETKSLAEKITKGKAVVRHNLNFYWVDADTDDGGSSIANTGTDIASKANAKLIAEAFNVANETGMTPRELLAKLREARRLLKNTLSLAENVDIDRGHSGPCGPDMGCDG